MLIVYELEGHPDAGGVDENGASKKGRHFEIMLPKSHWVAKQVAQEKKDLKRKHGHDKIVQNQERALARLASKVVDGGAGPSEP